MSGNNSPAPPPPQTEVKPDQGQISLRVVNAEGQEVFFKVKRTTKMSKLMDAYCKKQGISRTQVRFMVDGNAVNEEATPDALGLEDDDVVDAMAEQIGGCVLSTPGSSTTSCQH